MKPNDIIILVSLVIVMIMIVVVIAIKKEKYTPAVWEQKAYNCSRNPGYTPGCPLYSGNDNGTTLSQAPTNQVGTLTITADGTIVTSLTSAVPVGSIVAWAGSGKPPLGWAVCNGQTIDNFTTPDLTGRFLIGAGQSIKQNVNTLSTYQIGDYGGEEVHKLTVDEIPAHTHTLTTIGGNSGSLSGGGSASWGNGITNPTGGDLPHNNLPPYYALLYIIKYM
jgi:microcystin-dependent protein